MKLKIAVLSVFLLFQLKLFAQKSCFDSIHYFDIHKDFVKKLKKTVKNQDSSFIYYHSHNGVQFGISAFKKDGKIVISETINDGKEFEINDFPKKGRMLIEQFYSNEIFNDTREDSKEPSTGSRIYFVDDGAYEIFVFKSKKICWVYGPYIYGFSKSTRSWVNEFNEFVWKRQTELYRK